jgi:hypothetical protein
LIDDDHTSFRFGSGVTGPLMDSWQRDEVSKHSLCWDLAPFCKTVCFFDFGQKSGFIAFSMESLILAQNERWQRGLGMQVEREAMSLIFRERTHCREWRKGEEHVGNLPLGWGQLLERGANTEYGASTHVGDIKAGDSSEPGA